MKTWQTFLTEKHTDSKAIMGAEEKSGLDIDHDNEKGEAPAHVAKVHKTHQEMVAFFTKRKSGASNIATEARGKGPGPASLTVWHFTAKARPYQEVLAAIKAGKSESYFRQKCESAMRRVHASMKNQQSFQEAMGELEVWGEACIQLFNRK